MAAPCQGATVSCGLLASCAGLSLTAILGERHSYPNFIDKGLRNHIYLLLQKERLIWASFHTEPWRSFWNSRLPVRPATARCSQDPELGMGLKKGGVSPGGREKGYSSPRSISLSEAQPWESPIRGRAAKTHPRLPEIPMQDRHHRDMVAPLFPPLPASGKTLMVGKMEGKRRRG